MNGVPDPPQRALGIARRVEWRAIASSKTRGGACGRTLSFSEGEGKVSGGGPELGLGFAREIWRVNLNENGLNPSVLGVRLCDISPRGGWVLVDAAGRGCPPEVFRLENL